MSANKGRVLCVDDEPQVVRALQWLLQKDFEVHTVTSAADGLRVLLEHDFDVVISDQRMPGIPGVEFLREARKVAPRAIRILLTGYADLDAMTRSVNESEIYRFVTKPWDVRELPRVIAEAVQIAQQAPWPPQDPDSSELTPGVESSGRSEADASAPEGPPVPVARDDESILLIDDDASVRDEIHHVLGGTVRVRDASNLAEAVHALDQAPASVVISDVRVGKVDVTRLIGLMKQTHPEIVTVVFSGVQDAQVVMNLINQGQVYRFIPKPFKPTFLRLVVDSAMRRHRQLAGSPEIRRRYRVESADKEAVQSLRRDVERAAADAGVLAGDVSDSSQHLARRISGGFRRLFGT